MNFYKYFIGLLICLLTISCTDEKKPKSTDIAPSATEPGSISVNNTSTSNAVQTTTSTAASINSNGTVEHYICPNGHIGNGSSSAGNCSKCGSELTHNQAWHNQSNGAGSQITTNQVGNGGAVSPLVVNPAGQSSTTRNLQANNPVPTAAPTEPAQNAAGVWHYTCSNGCAGGAGSATACAGCGSTLAHNSAYHN